MTGDEIGDRHDQALPAAKSRFRESLLVLDQRVDWIPMGWQRLYGDLPIKLRTIECEARSAVFVLGAYETQGSLHVEAVTDDEVVQGILRKARARAAATCMGCGKRGRPREIGDEHLTLCAACAGCVSLREEVLTALAKRDRGDFYNAVSESPLIAEVILASAARGGEPAKLAGIEPETITEWLDAILNVLDPIFDGIRQ